MEMSLFTKHFSDDERGNKIINVNEITFVLSVILQEYWNYSLLVQVFAL